MVECKYCGKEFESKRGLNVHIGHKHPEENKNAECDYCGKKFHKIPSKISNHNFCSKECYYKWRSENIKGKNHPGWKGGKITKVCKQCRQEFRIYPSEKDTKFCSKECFKKYQGRTSWNKEKIIKKLKEVSKELGHSPKWKELREIGERTLIALCRKYFGSFSKAKKAAGLKLYEKQWNKEKVLEELREEAKKLGHSPTQKELLDRDKGNLIDACYRYFEGSFNEAKKEAGLKIIHKINKWNKEKVIKELKKEAKRLGHSPTQEELRDKDRKDLIAACQDFGGLNQIKKEAGLEIYKKDWNKEKIIKKLKEVSKELGHSPKWKELREINSALASICQKYFDSFNSAKKIAGLETYRRGIFKRHQKPTKPEQRIIDICKEHNFPFKYVGDYSFFIGDLNPDFIHNNGSKKVIEVFGDVFHNPKKSFRENIPWYQTEFGRKAYFSQFGYDTLILWTSEMKEMSNKEIKRKVKTFNKK